MTHGQPFDVDQPIWSESAGIRGGTDGGDGFLVRICRYPTAGVAWIWASVTIGGRYYAYNVDFHRCSSDVVAVDSDDVAYVISDARCTMERRGPRMALTSARLSCGFSFHDDVHPPNGFGVVPIDIEATFLPGAMSGEARIGRLEARGSVTGTIVKDGRVFAVEGEGHWHEQHQTEPRFRSPFTYASLRGDGVALVAIRNAGRVSGIGRCAGGKESQVVDFTIDPPAPSRALAIAFSDGTRIEGIARVRHEYSVSIYGKRRPGTDVVVDGAELHGIINDWEP